VAGKLVFDKVLTRRWASRCLRLWTPRPAYLADEGQQKLIGDCPAGAWVRVAEAWRVGPLNADVRLLAQPVAAPELWLVASWLAVEIPQGNAPPREVSSTSDSAV
jgi:hypothetical protein